MTACPMCGAYDCWCAPHPTRDNRIQPMTPIEKALSKFDDENNVEPTRRIAERIALKYGAGPTHSLVDDIHHAIEDAYNLGARRGVFHY